MAWFPDTELPDDTSEKDSTAPPLEIAVRCGETIPTTITYEGPVVTGPLKVFTQISLVREFLKHPCFELVDNKEDADILWLLESFRDYEELRLQRPNQFISQVLYSLSFLLLL